MMSKDIEQIMAGAECLYEEREVERAISYIAKSVSTTLSESNPVILTVMNGGLVFAGKLLTQLKFPLQVDYCHATRYQNEASAGQLLWKVLPQMDLANRNILVVDDIYDQGHTLMEIITALRAQGGSNIFTTVLVNKLHERKADPEFKVDFVGLDVPDKFVFGYGMDYRGYLRNIAGIYAARADES